MSSYKDLTDNVDDSFDFMLRGKKYTMRYPKTSEIEEIQQLNEKLSSLDSQSQEAKDITEDLNNSFYQFITPEGHELEIKDALQNENVKVLKNFNTMIKTELAV